MRRTILVLLALAAPSGFAQELAKEPVLYSSIRETYKVLTRQRLLALHGELSKSLGTRVHLRVIPYIGAGNKLKAENLEVYYQEKAAELPALRDNMKKLAVTVLDRLGKSMGPDASVTFYARLPEGKRIRDLKVETNPNCLDKTALTQRINVADHTPGRPPAEVLTFLCDIPSEQDLDADFVARDRPLIPEVWRTSAAPR